jgi:antitoxin component YwqK of YwqJK toxin-antitoxin module
MEAKEKFIRQRIDKMEGEYLQYYKTGELMAKKNFVDGKEDGKAVTYYETGELKEVQILS